MADTQTIATYDTKARDYAKLLRQDAPDASLQAFIELMPVGGAVLDLGCGPGTASHHMAAAGLRPDAVDAAPGMVALARERYGLPARPGHFDDINGQARYAGVWANFSLLHAPRQELPRYFKALHDVLRDGGTLHVGMKTGKGEARDDLGRLYTFVTVSELTDLFTSADFTVTHSHEGRAAGFAGTIDPFVIMRGAKNG